MVNKKFAVRAFWASITGNIFLSVFKLLAGIFAHSSAMVSDAVHSAADVLSTVVVIVGIKLSGRSSDKEHPYGHERFECVAAILLSVFLFVTGAGIGWDGVNRILSGASGELTTPGVLALIAPLVSIAVKEAMYWYTRRAAQKIDSGALMADAWHHRMDALSSVGSFLGILGARLGFPILDPAASVVICLFIVKAAYSIFRDAVGKMTDKSCDDATVEKIRDIILEQESIRGIDKMKTRLFGNKIYVDVEISIDAGLTLKEAHELSHEVHDAVEASFPKVKHCMVHVSPEE